MTTERLRVVITGATSGLGREMAVQLGRRRWRVAVTGRREDRLAETVRLVEEAGGDCLPLIGSVTEPELVRDHYAAIKREWGGLDWAILNAGMGHSHSAREFDAEIARQTFRTNVEGAANWLEAVIPDMVAAGSGTIAGIASIAGFRGLPTSGTYCGSKAALITLLESVRVDLWGTGVRVVTVCPGFVKSEITARHEPGEMMWLLETDDGVRRILRGIEKGKRMVAFPWQMSLLMRQIVRRIPGFVYDRIFSSLYRRHARRKGRNGVTERKR